jgi:hypothetical protein
MSSRVPATVASAVGGRSTIVIRYAQPADGPELSRLADLADRRLPNTLLLVAEADGQIVAAAPAVSGGDVVTNPFLVTSDVVDLLRLRSSQLRAAA